MSRLEPPLIGDYEEYTQCQSCKQVFPTYSVRSTRACCPTCGCHSSLKTVIAREICVRKHIGFLIWKNVHSHYEVRR